MGASFWRKNLYWLLSKLRNSGCCGWVAQWGGDHRLNSMLLRWSENPSHMPTSEATEPFNHKALLNLVKLLWSWHLSWLHAHSYRRAMFWGQRGDRIQSEGPVNQVLVLWELWHGRYRWKQTYANMWLGAGTCVAHSTKSCSACCTVPGTSWGSPAWGIKNERFLPPS